MKKEFRYYTLADALYLIWRWKIAIFLLLLIISIVVAVVDINNFRNKNSLESEKRIVLNDNSKKMEHATLYQIKEIVNNYSLGKKIFLADLAAFMLIFLILLFIDPFLYGKSDLE